MIKKILNFTIDYLSINHCTFYTVSLSWQWAVKPENGLFSVRCTVSQPHIIVEMLNGWLSFVCRTQAKVDYLMSTESSEGLMAEMGAQALATGTYQPPETVLQAIDAITQDDVVKVSVL